MNEKIGGVVALLVALMLAVAIGSYNTSSAATANQQVQVSVPEAISIAVDTPLNFGNQTAGATYTSPNYNIQNTGNVKIDLYVNTNDTAFRPTTPNTNDVIDINGNYKIKSNVTGNFEQLSTNLLKIYDNMPKASQGSGTPFTWTTQQQLTIPAFTEDGTYVITLIYTAVKHNVQP